MMMAAPDPAPLIELRGVSKIFGTVIALNDVSFAVRAGEVHCLLGDNGAGKSTLIKILSGVHLPTLGEFRLDGQPARVTSPRDALDRGIATVFQDRAAHERRPQLFHGTRAARRLGTVPSARLDSDEPRGAGGDVGDRYRHPRS